MIAALYVGTGGCYFGTPWTIDPWDEVRDARRYCGPWPVVAHPPCQRWGKLATGQPLHIKRTGERKTVGDDGGCFAAALSAVRKFGGVLEHPEHSKAWRHFGLNKPPRAGGWVKADNCDGWTCCVEQGRYGHYARKPTWLYVNGVFRPALAWGVTKWEPDAATVARIGLQRAKRRGEVAAMGGGTDDPDRIATPPLFRDLLVSMAASANRA